MSSNSNPRPTVAQVKADLETLRGDLVHLGGVHDASARDFHQRITRMENFIEVLGGDATVGTIERWANEASAIRQDHDRLVARISVVEVETERAHARLDQALDPRAKGSLPKVHKGMEKAHRRISMLGEAVYAELASMQEQITAASATGGQKGVIMTLRAARVDDATIRDFLGLVGDGELDLDDSAFVAEWFTAYTIHHADHENRIGVLEQTVPDLQVAVKKLETTQTAQAIEIRANASALASAQGFTVPDWAWIVGLIAGLLAWWGFATANFPVGSWRHDWWFAPMMGVLFMAATVGVVSAVFGKGGGVFTRSSANATIATPTPPAPPTPPSDPATRPVATTTSTPVVAAV